MTLILRQLFDAPSSTYTYLLGDEETGEAVIIDAVFERFHRDCSLARELDLTIVYALETHVHADHVSGAWLMREALGAAIGVSQDAGAEGADLPLVHGQTLAFGSHALEVRATPGHTSGCVTYVLDAGQAAFTGDCLLIRGAGRTDFQEGNAEIMYRSIHEQILSLPERCAIYPAHDYAGRTASSVKEEKAHNPRAGGQRSVGDFVGYMNNLNLPHPKKLDIAVPANLKLGRPEDGQLPVVANWGPVRATYAGTPEIDAAWVFEHRDRVHLLDVREPDEHAQNRIEGSQLIPLGELDARVSELPRDRPIVAVCRSGGRSAQAINLLKRAGLTEAANLCGGMLAWQDLQASP